MPAPDPLPGSASLEQAVLDRAAALHEDARTALLVAALSDDGDLGVLAAALRALDVSPEVLAEAEAAGLVALDGGRCAFSQPSCAPPWRAPPRRTSGAPCTARSPAR